MAWVPDGEKNVEDMFTRFGRIHERDRQTVVQLDGQTPHDGIGRDYAQHRAAKTVTLFP